MRPHGNRSPAAQHGIVLITALVFLLLLTMLATGSMRDTTLQERMAGNLRDRSLALQAAEAALREAETWLLGPGGALQAAALSATLESAHDWDGADPEPSRPALDGFDDDGLLSGAPAVQVSPARTVRVLEGSAEVGTGAPAILTAHEVTARGVGGRDTTIVVLQTTVVLP